MLAIVTFSYEQTIHAYPGGGGAYIVARDNLGEGPAQRQGGIAHRLHLTVAVSISSGVAQITSAFPDLLPYRVWISLGHHLSDDVDQFARGERIDFCLFAPNVFLFGDDSFTIGLGFYRYFTGTLGAVTDVEMMHAVTQDLTLFLILKAFSRMHGADGR